ncbi:MAG: IPT/TIG domain-containing protein [Candidatus Saganbacteria bacterium]|nr:IPT/TIG domain-containing protein [Candidatus Saganbacteria bacterium]
MVLLLLLALLIGSPAAAYQITGGAANSGSLAGGSAGYNIQGAGYGSAGTFGTSSGYSLFSGSANWLLLFTTAASATFDTPAILSITPDAGPPGAKFTVIGSKFGAAQGGSSLVFENDLTHITYTAAILSWSDTLIEAIRPNLATSGSYTVKVIRSTFLSGATYFVDSNAVAQRINAAAAGEATVYPNPFNPLAAPINLLIANTSGATNVGFYIYDMTAELVSRQIVSAAPYSVTWDGKDRSGAQLADGVYLLRVVNEDTHALIAKGKILLVKK